MRKGLTWNDLKQLRVKSKSYIKIANVVYNDEDRIETVRKKSKIILMLIRDLL